MPAWSPGVRVGVNGNPVKAARDASGYAVVDRALKAGDRIVYTLRIPTRFVPGFMKSMDNRKRSMGAQIFGPDIDSVILSSAAFGHVGAGGSLGFADPAAGLSFGYTMNRMGPGLLLNDRGQALVDATYLSLGYKNKDGGVWSR